MYARLCDTVQVSAGSMRQFYLKDKEFLVVNYGGVFFCLDGRCTHAGAPLAEGTLEGEVLTCPWHYSQFNITTGAVLRGPARKSLSKYKSLVKDGQLFIDLDNKGAEEVLGDQATR